MQPKRLRISTTEPCRGMWFLCGSAWSPHSALCAECGFAILILLLRSCPSRVSVSSSCECSRSSSPYAFHCSIPVSSGVGDIRCGYPCVGDIRSSPSWSSPSSFSVPLDPSLSPSFSTFPVPFSPTVFSPPLPSPSPFVSLSFHTLALLLQSFAAVHSPPSALSSPSLAEMIN